MGTGQPRASWLKRWHTVSPKPHGNGEEDSRVYIASGVLLWPAEASEAVALLHLVPFAAVGAVAQNAMHDLCFFVIFVVIVFFSVCFFLCCLFATVHSPVTSTLAPAALRHAGGQGAAGPGPSRGLIGA